MDKKQLIFGSTLALLAVMLGAFGAHALEAVLTANDRVATYDTAVQYHMFHALAILICGVIYSQRPHRLIKTSSWLFTAGTAIFSGSLYVLSISGLTFLGAITPLGGLCFMAGWVVLIVYLIKHY